MIRLLLPLALGLILGCSDNYSPDAYPAAAQPDPAAGPDASPADPGQGDPGVGPQDPVGEDVTPAPPAGRPRVDVTVGGGAPVDVVPEDTIAEAPTRQRRRMDLDQLSASMRLVTDGIGWTARRGAEDVDQFVELASTLGKPDFVQITTEDLEPSALFQKFLDDAARSACDKVVARDVTRVAVPRLLARPDETEDETLQRLILRFHGRRLAADAPDLEHWRWLIRSTTHVIGSVEEAWRGVCVALLTHPDFYSY